MTIAIGIQIVLAVRLQEGAASGRTAAREARTALQTTDVTDVRWLP
jgi:hypothetical protein